jgi:hypothetical protein
MLSLRNTKESIVHKYRIVLNTDPEIKFPEDSAAVNVYAQRRQGTAVELAVFFDEELYVTLSPLIEAQFTENGYFIFEALTAEPEISHFTALVLDQSNRIVAAFVDADLAYDIFKQAALRNQIEIL